MRTKFTIRSLIPILLLISLPSILKAAAPPNDNCTGITATYVLVSSTTCTNSNFTLDQATASTGFLAGCASAGTHYDVWFSFVAASSTQTVAIGGFSNTTKITNPEIQLFSGSCGSLTSIICGTTSFKCG
jgi:hypothetical protein